MSADPISVIDDSIRGMDDEYYGSGDMPAAKAAFVRLLGAAEDLAALYIDNGYANTADSFEAALVRAVHGAGGLKNADPAALARAGVTP